MVVYKKYYKCFAVLLFLWGSFLGVAQNKTIDALPNKSFQDLANSFYKNEKDSSEAVIFANAYLKRAKKIKDSIKIADAFYFLSIISKGNLFLNYSDSIIIYTKKLKSKFYPVVGYLNKGDYYYKKRHFYKSLENYLLANNSLDNKNSSDLLYNLKHRIGLLKTRYDNNEEALSLFREIYKYNLDKEYNEKKPSYHLEILFALSDSFLRNGYPDSSSYYNKLGIKKSFQIKDSVYYNYFTLEEGIVEFKREKYKSSIDSILKALTIIGKTDDLPNIAYANHFLGKSYLKLNQTEKSTIYFKKVDSIFQIIKDIHPDLRSSYEYLIENYKKKGNLKKQLEYIQKLLKVDSTLHTNYKNINLQLVRKYDTPKLLIEKNSLIENLEKNRKSKNITLILFGLLILISSIIAIYQNKKRKSYKKRFEEILAENEKIPTIENPTSRLNVPKEIELVILKGLSTFEEQQQFLNSSITLNGLAKRLKTNTSYLSKVINYHKNSSFSNYINELRISYTVEELKSNTTFQKFTIKAIAEEAGFNNAESFAKAFYKIKGIKPSYFLREIQKIETKN